MKISRMNPFDGSSKTVAFFDVETEEGINIKGFTLVEGTNGLFMGIPSEKGKDGKYYDRVYVPKELKEQLTEMAISMYNESKGEAASASGADDTTPF
ncbi:MAG: septation protein SpoVG family protein [Bacteroidetes bacterium]|nr:septation protein SpoVG family protein [Bacteroidota bacterium]